MLIDNFDKVREHLTFNKAVKFDSKTKEKKELNDTYDRYIVQIIRRAKDAKGKAWGVNTSSRLIKTYEISSLEYFDKKREHIIDLCKLNGARAYIHPQVRSTYDCLKEMLKQIVDNLENPTIKFQHILRSSLCKMHKSRDPKWVIDLDNDDMYGWTVDDIVMQIKDNIKECKKNPEDLYVLPTRNGTHIITTPFNLKAAEEKCFMMFEGVRKGNQLEDVIDVLHTDFAKEDATKDWKEHKLTPFNAMNWLKKYYSDTELKEIRTLLDSKRKEITGWVHKDGMTLLYADL